MKTSGAGYLDTQPSPAVSLVRREALLLASCRVSSSERSRERSEEESILIWRKKRGGGPRCSLSTYCRGLSLRVGYTRVPYLCVIAEMNIYQRGAGMEIGNETSKEKNGD